MSVEGWWFCAVPPRGEEPKLPHGDGRVVRVGETLTVAPPITPCRHGLHASRRAIDALWYAPGSWVCLVRLSGEIRENGDKLAASERTVLWMGDATRSLHQFAVDVARDALLRERKLGREPDPRSWAALGVKERWINRLATTEELAAAARDAARASARAATSAAWDAADAAAAGAAQNKRLTRALMTVREGGGR